jgi:hypothetical protein
MQRLVSIAFVRHQQKLAATDAFTMVMMVVDDGSSM